MNETNRISIDNNELFNVINKEIVMISHRIIAPPIINPLLNFGRAGVMTETDHCWVLMKITANPIPRTTQKKW